MDISESRDFLVSTASLKEVRVFSREVFEKINIPQDQKDELVLAIAEAAQNIVKHGYKGIENTTDKKSYKTSSFSSFGFYSYLFIFLFLLISLLGILNLTKNILVFNFPFLENYITYLFENIDIFIIMIKDLFNSYQILIF